MIIFTTIDPCIFMAYNERLHLWNGIEVYNINSYDARFPMIHGLFPRVGDISDYALLHDDSIEFDSEFWGYLLQGGGFNQIVQIAAKEYNNGDILQLFQFNDSITNDSILESLIHIFIDRYGFQPLIVKAEGDLPTRHQVAISMGSFTIPGLVNMNEDIMKYIQTNNIPIATREELEEASI